MKKLIFGLIATVMLGNLSFGQSGCSSDCLLGECRIKCDKGAVASCQCIIGMFSSCKCNEKVMISDSQYLGKLSVDQISKVNKIIDFTIKNKLDYFTFEINKAIDAIKLNDSKNYQIALDNLISLEYKFPNETLKIIDFVNTLK